MERIAPYYDYTREDAKAKLFVRNRIIAGIPRELLVPDMELVLMDAAESITLEIMSEYWLQKKMGRKG